jgi:hypothetical protein
VHRVEDGDEPAHLDARLEKLGNMTSSRAEPSMCGVRGFQGTLSFNETIDTIHSNVFC